MHAPELSSDIQARAGAVVEAAQTLAIRSADDYVAAGEYLVGTATLRREIEEWFRPLKEAARESHMRLCAAERHQITPLVEAERQVKALISAYEAERERVRRAIEAELRERAVREEEDARLAEAARLEAEGHGEMAERVLEMPVEAPVVMLDRPRQPEGVIMRTTWRGEVFDFPALVQAVAQGRAPQTLLRVDQSALDGMARALKGALDVPGCRAVAERGVTVTAKRAHR